MNKALRRTGIVLGVLVLAVAALVWFWNWDWFVPLVNRYASSSLGRKVSVQHLHVRLGRVTRVAVDGVRIANPDGFPQEQEFLTADRLAVSANVVDYIRHREIVVPEIEVDKPVVNAEQKPNGDANWNFAFAGSNNAGAKPSTAPSPQIGDLQINDGHAHVVDPKLKADFNLDVHTVAPQNGNSGQIVVDAHGRYADQPVTGRFVGGALLTLRDNAKPYPVNLQLANGPTKVALVGTLTDPVKFAGANLKLEFSGPNMALLFPLTGVPIPETPPFSIAGKLDYAEHKVKFQDFHGRVGSSDLNGEIDVDPTGHKPVVDANLYSRRVDLTDLGGFIGTAPGHAPGSEAAGPKSAQQQHELAAAEAKPNLLPNNPINLPKVEAANIHLRYKGEKIENRYVPLDNIVADLDIDDGRIRLHPLSFAVGSGEIASTIDLTPEAHTVAAKANIDFRRVDLSRLLDATHMFHGQGIVGGAIQIDTTGNSIATFLGNGNGGVKLFVEGGGDISALLSDLVGFQFGDAILSALGVPRRANLECFVSDLPLVHGDLQSRVFLLDTSETQITGSGSINLRDEALDFTLHTNAKHFTIGSLPTPIDIRGTFKHPSVRPDAAALAERGGAAVGLGILFPPLALLPTIQLGVGENGACSKAITTAQSSGGPPARLPPPSRRR